MINTDNWNFFKCAWVPCSKAIPESKTGIVLDWWSANIPGSYCGEKCVRDAEDYVTKKVLIHQ